ncbi:MAG: hypothetical protein V4457_12890 [Pseudomonadota bacterium]
MLTFLLSGVGLKLIGVLGAVIAAAGAMFAARRSGVVAQQAADMKSTLKHIEAAHEVQADVARLSDTAVDDGLREFTRSK